MLVQAEKQTNSKAGALKHPGNKEKNGGLAKEGVRDSRGIWGESRRGLDSK
jgi:hypothetical protein